MEGKINNPNLFVLRTKERDKQQQNQQSFGISPNSQQIKERKEDLYKALYTRIYKVTLEYMQSVFDFDNNYLIFL